MYIIGNEYCKFIELKSQFQRRFMNILNPFSVLNHYDSLYAKYEKLYLNVRNF